MFSTGFKIRICGTNLRAVMQVIPGKGAPDIVIILIAAFRQLLELGYYQFVASFAVPEGAHFIVNLLPAVNA